MRLKYFFLILLLLPVSGLHSNTTPKAVVSLSLMADEILAYVAAPKQIRAFSKLVDDENLSNVPLEISRSIKGRAGPSLELLLSLKPDLILAADWNNPADIRYLMSKGISVTVLKTPSSWLEIIENVRIVGKNLNQEKQAEEFISKWEVKRKKLNESWDKSKILKMQKVLEYNYWGTTGTKNSLWQTILDLAHVENPAKEFKSDQWGFAPLSKETILTINPDYLVLTENVYGNKISENRGESLLVDPIMKKLTAVKENKILRIPEKFKSSSSPFILNAATFIFKKVYPSYPLDE